VDRRPWRRVGALLLAVLVTAAIYGIAYLRHQDSENWNRLETQAAQFKAPTGWTSIGHVKAGSYACWIACDAATVTVVYSTIGTPQAGCEQVLVAVAAQVGKTKPDPIANGCGWQAHAPAGGGPAYVTAGAQPANALLGPLAPPWTHKLRPTGSGTLVWIVFSAESD
jgi:hypothetical protein